MDNLHLFSSFEFGNGSRMSDEKLAILEFKYQNKKWYNRAGKVRFSGTQKSVLLEASPGECCVPHHFVLLSH